MEDLLECLVRLSVNEEADSAQVADGQGQATIGTAELHVVRSCKESLDNASEEDVAEFWRALVQTGQVSFLQLTKALGRYLRDPQQAWASCAFYSTLLRLKGCPVSAPALKVYKILPHC